MMFNLLTRNMTRTNLLILVAFLFLSLTACKKDNSSSSGRAALNVMLTDDPASYDQVNIDVQSIEIHSDNGGWITLNGYPGIYNLLDLTNGLDTLIANDSIPAGTISQVRLHLGTNNTIMVDSVIYPLEIPSGYTSGLKINVHQVVTGGTAYTLLLDFDAGHSIVETGNNEYKLKPVIHGQFVNGVSTDGTIIGVVMPPASNAFVSAINSSDGASTYINVTTGQYSLQNLTLGPYTIWINTNPPYNDTTFIFNAVAGTNSIDTIWVD